MSPDILRRMYAAVDSAQPWSQALKQVEELYRRGELTIDEFRPVAEKLCAKVQESLQPYIDSLPDASHATS